MNALPQYERYEEKLKENVEKTRKAAAAAAGYVRGNPWPAIGIALAAGALLAFLAARK